MRSLSPQMLRRLSSRMRAHLAAPLIICAAISMVSFSYSPVHAESPSSANPSHSSDGSKSLKLPQEVAEATDVSEWKDASVKPSVVLFCIHGLGLHKGTYADFGKSLAARGVITEAIDMRGFGVRKNEKPVDFDGNMADIKKTLKDLRAKYPTLPIVMAGESMGGAIAIRAAALFPDLVDGLISSVPSGERFNATDTSAKIGLHAALGGLNKPVDLSKIVVDAATKKEDLRDTWKNDPLVVTELTPTQLMAFQSFMDKNFEAAHLIKSMPVLFIQGSNDKLVRPAGTWRLFEAVDSPNKQLVLSENSEHLIFEENQFKPADLKFVTAWLAKNVSDKGVNATASVSSALTSAASPASTLDGTDVNYSYWVELQKDGATSRWDSKSTFVSGDGVRLHVKPESNCYVYVTITGSSGKSALLIPRQSSAESNLLAGGSDRIIPESGWLRFDATPGVENLHMAVMPSPLNATSISTSAPGEPVIKYEVSSFSPSKEKMPPQIRRETQLAWDDPDPVAIPIPDDLHGGKDLEGANTSPPRTGDLAIIDALKKLRHSGNVVDIALEHK